MHISASSVSMAMGDFRVNVTAVIKTAVGGVELCLHGDDISTGLDSYLAHKKQEVCFIFLREFLWGWW